MAGAALGTGRVELALKVEQLTHEVEVGRNVGFLAPDEVVGVVEAHRHLVHEVGHRDGHRARYARQTVHQYALSALPSSVCTQSNKIFTLKSIQCTITA